MEVSRGEDYAFTNGLDALREAREARRLAEQNRVDAAELEGLRRMKRRAEAFEKVLRGKEQEYRMSASEERDLVRRLALTERADDFMHIRTSVVESILKAGWCADRLIELK